jgi:hypothetical protein
MAVLLTWQSHIADGHEVNFNKLAVAEQYRPLLRPTLECQSGILGLAAATLRPSSRLDRDEFTSRPRPPAAAEIFTDGVALYIVSVRSRVTSRVNAKRGRVEEPLGTVTLNYFGPPSHVGSLDAVKNAAEAAFGVELKPISFRSNHFEELRTEGRVATSPPSSEERIASDVLRNRGMRALITAIKAAGGLLVRDLARQLPSEDRDRIDAIRERLRELGLLESEIVVICGKSQTQTARVPSREVLVESSNRGLRCACGRAIADERVEEALTVTEFGRSILDKSRWLTIIVVEQLMGLGVPADNILVEQQVGGDEVDCLANIRGQLVLFELKDKEFNLGSAYSFGAKIGIIRPAHAVIVSTEHVGGDAKEHFQRARQAQSSYSQRYVMVDEAPTDIQYVEGIENLAPRVDEIVSSIYAQSAVGVLEQVLPLAFPDSQALVEAFASRVAGSRRPTSPCGREHG